MVQLIKYHVNSEQGYGVITLNRPEKRNAMSLEMADQFLTILKNVEHDPIKYLVITGAGDEMFCSGGDLTDYHGGLLLVDAEKRLRKMMDVLYHIAVFKLPTIALLNGGAMGGGCELASACDIRIAKQGTKFGFVQSTLGIIPGWGGGVLLRQRVHSSFANQWIMEGNVMDAEHLEKKGWIHRVVSMDEFNNKDKLLSPYSSKSLEQMNILKELCFEGMEVERLKDRMKTEVRRCASLWGSEIHQNAVLAFINKKRNKLEKY